MCVYLTALFTFSIDRIKVLYFIHIEKHVNNKIVSPEENFHIVNNKQE